MQLEKARMYYQQEVADWNVSILESIRARPERVSMDMIDWQCRLEATLEYLGDSTSYITMCDWEDQHLERVRTALASTPDHRPIYLDKYHFGFSFFDKNRTFDR
jgi:hypothetical protein